MESPQPSRPRGLWGPVNRLLYRLYTRVRGRPPRRSGAEPSWPQAGGPDASRPVLLVAWGRIGDMVLASGMIRQLGRLFQQPVVVLGRPEVEPLVTDQVHRFVPFLMERWQADEQYRRVLLADLHNGVSEFDVVLGDIHLFHGGGPWLNDLIDLLPARHKFVYEGYADRQVLAPHRCWPQTATLIPSLRKTDENRHLLHDTRHYLSLVLAHSGRSFEVRARDLLPGVRIHDSDDGLLPRHGLVAHNYIACQPFSNNVKKDYPLDAWRQVFASFSDSVFVLLGSDKEATRAACLVTDNVRNLCGKTSLAESMQLLEEAELFLGIDSGLAHIAACLGTETVCVSQNNNLGWFFPYPEECGADNLHVVHNPLYEACSGCFMACEHEPIWRMYQRGSLCLRTLSPGQVSAAIRVAISRIPEPQAVDSRI